MAQLALLKQQAGSVVKEYFERLRVAEARRDVETAAVTKIQAHARGFIVRRRLLHLGETALIIQRHWRGYLGRLRAKLALELHNKELRQRYFDAKATVIQKWWRGFFSRKYIHDFYARKAYLEAVKARNEEIRAELHEEAERSIALQRQEVEERARRLFEEKVSKLHHLVSTQSQPGIFASPYALATGTAPVILGAPVEDHLKHSMRTQVRTQKLPPLKARTGPVYPQTVMLNGKTIPARLTLRQAADVDAVHQNDILEEKVHRAEMLTVHPQPFAASLSKPFQPFLDVQTNRNTEHFVDYFDPTIGNRGERFTPDQAKISKYAFRKYLHKTPFFDTNTVEGY